MPERPCVVCGEDVPDLFDAPAGSDVGLRHTDNGPEWWHPSCLTLDRFIELREQRDEMRNAIRAALRQPDYFALADELESWADDLGIDWRTTTIATDQPTDVRGV